MFDVPRDTEALEQEKETLQPRRWRLLMYYMDHTVLSFELSRMRVDESPSLSDMVVYHFVYCIETISKCRMVWLSLGFHFLMALKL